MLAHVPRGDLRQLLVESVQRAQIPAAQILRLRQQFLRYFQPNEFGHRVELESQFVVVENLDQHHFVTVVSHPLDSRFDLLQIRKEITKYNNDLTTPHACCQFVQAFCHFRLLDGIDFLQMVRHADDLVHRIAWGHETSHMRIERGQRHLVALPHN